MLRTLALATALLGITVLTFAVVGCGRTETPPSVTSQTNGEPAAPTQEESEAPGGHGHAPGAHGGTIVEIGRDNYHAEVVFEKDGVLRLFTLGNDETKVEEVESQTITTYAKAAGGSESAPFELTAEPQSDDSAGKTSQFVGQLPDQFTGQVVEVTIPSIRINGERFRLGFSSAADGHDEHGNATMPEKAADSEEAALYLTQGGIYTVADIEANGNQTASQKFKGLKASHDLNPKPGDKICPITLTKANPKFTWTIGGEEYEFCCPPCVDEFVRLAKESPDEIKSPDAYVRK